MFFGFFFIKTDFHDHSFIEEGNSERGYIVLSACKLLTHQHSGGIAYLLGTHFNKFVSVILSDNNSVWLKISKCMIGYEKTL